MTETPEAGYTANNAELKGNIPAGSAATAAFVNNYSAGQATLSGATNLEVTKEFTGKDWGDEVFTFTLTLTDGDDAKVKLPENADSLQIGKDTPDHKAAFGDIILQQPENTHSRSARRFRKIQDRSSMMIMQ